MVQGQEAGPPSPTWKTSLVLLPSTELGLRLLAEGPTAAGRGK